MAAPGLKPGTIEHWQQHHANLPLPVYVAWTRVWDRFGKGKTVRDCPGVFTSHTLHVTHPACR